MPNPNEVEIITVLGKSGSGKSSWIQKALPQIPRFILWDTMGEYAGFDIFEDRMSLYDHVCRNHDGIIQAIFNNLEEDDREVFDWTCRLVLALEWVCFIVEEVDNYANPQEIPNDLRRVLKVGRHYGVSMVFVTQRPALVNRLVTAQSRRFVCFNTSEPGDIRYMRSHIGNAVDELSTLDDLHFLDWNHGHVDRGQIRW